MAELTVRVARVDDAAAVLDLHVRARSSYYRGFLDEDQLAADNRRDVGRYERMIGSGDRVVWCAEAGTALVGFLSVGPPYYPDPDAAVDSELYQLQVEPGWFGRGIGTRLLGTATARWQSSGVRAGRAWVWEFNGRARAFYARRGWRVDGHYRPDDPRIGAHRMLGYRLAVRDTRS